jgi:predicted CopG family antitoxin
MGKSAETHIRVREGTWRRLNQRKRPGDSFDDVIDRMLNRLDNVEGS